MKASEIVKKFGGTLVGPDIEIEKVSPPEDATPDSLVFLFEQGKEKEIRTRAGVLVCKEKPSVDVAHSYIIVSDPRKYMVQALSLFVKETRLNPGVSNEAYVDPTAKLGENVTVGQWSYIGYGTEIGENTVIYPHVFIGDNVKIGTGVKIYPFVYIGNDTFIGNRVVIHSGTKIGTDGFGFLKTQEGYLKIPQVGRVVIEDDVEIGANCAIDRATIGETRIGKGVKLDNLIQIGHNVTVGEHTVMAAQTGIAGSTKIGKWVMMGGQVGVADHLEIGDRAIIMAKSGVSKSVPPRKIYEGYMARERRQYLKSRSLFDRLPEFVERLKRLEREVFGNETENTEK